MMRNQWSPERDEELKRLKAAGHSASKIAALMHITRGAVLGRSNRLRRGLLRSDAKWLAAKRIAAQERREKAVAEKHEKEQVHRGQVLSALRADLEAGVDLNIVVKRALGAGIKRKAVAEFFGLSRSLVYRVAALDRVLPTWTSEQVRLLVSMRPDHSAAEIADALGTTRGAVLGKIWRIGPHR
jgi:hypothetical protein